MLCKLKRLRSCGSEFLFKRLKRNQKIAGDNAENTRVFNGVFPGPLVYGGRRRWVGFSMGCKICQIDSYAPT